MRTRRTRPSKATREGPMAVLDTNVILRYLTQENPDHSRRAFALIQQLVAGALDSAKQLTRPMPGQPREATSHGAGSLLWDSIYMNFSLSAEQIQRREEQRAWLHGVLPAGWRGSASMLADNDWAFARGFN